MFRIKYFILISIIIGFNSFLYAQEQKGKIEPYKPTKESAYTSRKDCIEKFDFDKIESQYYPLIEDNARLLYDYLQCRVIFEEDTIYSLLDRINSKDLNEHRKIFNSHPLKFFTDLIEETKISPGLINNCKSNLDLPVDKCRDFIKAFMSGDIAFCGGERTCEGYITLNENLAETDREKEIILYLKALKNSDINECQKIKDEFFKRVCQGYITRDKKICEQDDGFKKFKDIYCSEVIQIEAGRQVRYKLK